MSCMFRDLRCNLLVSEISSLPIRLLFPVNGFNDKGVVSLRDIALSGVTFLPFKFFKVVDIIKIRVKSLTNNSFTVKTLVTCYSLL